MYPSFQEDRATQVAGRLLQLSGGSISHMKLIKLMYLVERRALVRWGRLVTFDWLISMKHGPVLSATLDLINDEPHPVPSERRYWHRYISERVNHELRLISEAPIDALSPKEFEIVNEVFQEFGCMNQYQLRDWCHDNLPEWSDPSNSRNSIDLSDILRAEHFSPEDIGEVLDALKEEGRAYQILR